ncbi:helix-turn-helix domain-containing protein [Streptomyces sp. NPDC002537]
MSEATTTVLRRRLGSRLKTIRVRSGLNLAEAAKLLGFSGASPLSKIENGKQRPDLEKFLTAYRVEDEVHIAELRGIAQLISSSRQRALFAQFKDVIRSRFADFLELEEIAVRTDGYAATLVPGLLQTAAYAHGLIQGSNVWSTPHEVRGFIDLRMKRQDVLDQAADRKPLALRYVLDEACLRREIGGTDVLRGQIEHLLLMSKLPHIDLRVLPFAAGSHTGMDGSYTIFHLSVGEPVVAVEPLTDSLYLDEHVRVTRYTVAFDRLLTQALDPDTSRDFLTYLVGETP